MTENAVSDKAEPKAKAARTGPTAKAKPAAKTALGKVAKVKSSAKSEATAASLKSADLAAKTIEKFTSQKPIGFNDHPLPFVPTGSIGLDHTIGGVLAPDQTGP